MINTKTLTLIPIVLEMIESFKLSDRLNSCRAWIKKNAIGGNALFGDEQEWNLVFGHNLLACIWAQIGQEHEPLSN